MENRQNKQKKKLIDIVVKQASSIFSIIIMSLIIAMISMTVFGSKANLRIMGYSGFFIETFSMDSVYPAGSLVITKHNANNDYKVGDDISFYDNSKDGAIVTHRIVEVESDDQGYFYITKGVDNQNIDENSVYYKNVIGKVIYSVPEIGIYIDYAKQNIILVIVLITGSIILFKQVKSIVNNKKNGDDNNETEPNKTL